MEFSSVPNVKETFVVRELRCPVENTWSNLVQISASRFFRGNYMLSFAEFRNQHWVRLQQVILKTILVVSFSDCISAQALVGSGSTVPLPLYRSFSEQYNRRNSKIQMQYVPVGT